MTASQLFRQRGFGSNGASVQPLAKPPAAFPGRIVADADLAIAVNRQQTQLALPMNVSDTSMTVVSPSLIVANSLLSIDNEIVQATAAPSGNVVPVTRGFDGTTPAVHLASATVSGFIDAWHHNSLVAEVEAIEQTLGANLANIPAVSIILAPSYAFPPQSPGGSLSVGTNSIILSPVPKGVNGTDTHHYLYISGGTGAAEAVPITGGSAVAGAASGTIFVTCANTHSGAWTIQTATAGAQEAHNDKIGPVIFPAGTFDWYGPFWSNGQATIQGAGGGITNLRFNSLTFRMFDIERDYFLLQRLSMSCQGTPVAGNIGIYTAGLGGGPSGAACNNATIEDVFIWGFYNGIVTDGGNGAVNLTRVNVNNSVQDAIHSQGTQGYWDTVICVNNQGTAIKVSTSTTGGGGASPFMTGIQTFGSGGWGLYSTSNLNIGGTPSFFNNDKLGEIYIKAPYSAIGGWIKDASIQFAGSSPYFGTNNSAPALVIDTGTGPYTLDNLQFFNPEGNALVLNSSGHIVINCVILSPGQGGQAGNMYAMSLASGGTVQIANCSVNGQCLFNPGSGSGNMLRGNVFGGNLSVPLVEIASGSDWTITGNYFSNAGAGPSLQLDSGVSYMKGTNGVVGTLTNNGAISPRSRDLT